MFDNTVRRIAQRVSDEVLHIGGGEIQMYIRHDWSVIEYVTESLNQNPHMIVVLEMNPMTVTEFAHEVIHHIKKTFEEGLYV